MKKLVSILLAAVVACSLMCVGASAAEQTATVKVTGQYKRSMAAKVLTLVNKERTDRGYSKLLWDSTLEKAAMRRVAEIAVKFSHTRPDGTLCYTVNDEAVIKRFPTSGENIAAGSTSAAVAMNGWMNSTGHRENILDNNFTHIGVACAKINGVLYWVQMFGGGDYGASKKSTGKSVFLTSVKVKKSETKLIFTKSSNVWRNSRTKFKQIRVGKSQTVKLIAYDSSDNFIPAKLAISKFKLNSSNKKVLKISKKGKISALKTGIAYIKAVSRTNKDLVIRQKIKVVK